MEKLKLELKNLREYFQSELKNQRESERESERKSFQSERKSFQSERESFKTQIESLRREREEPERKRRRKNHYADHLWLLFQGHVMKMRFTESKIITQDSLRKTLEEGYIYGLTDCSNCTFHYKPEKGQGREVEDDENLLHLSTSFNYSLIMKNAAAQCASSASSASYEGPDNIEATFYDFNETHPGKMKVKVPPKIPLILFAEGQIKGVFQLVHSNVYFRIYYNSTAASDIFEFGLSETPEIVTFQKKQQRFTLEPFHFGSLVVDENLIGEDHTSLDPETSQKVLQSATRITALPELYINESIKKQLESRLQGTIYNVTSQKSTKEQPYNVYFKSNPDIVISRDDDSSLTVVTEAPITPPPDPLLESEQEEQEEPAEIEWVAELKKGTGTRGRVQLYAEAFNVAITAVTEKFRQRKLKDIRCVIVYCILLVDDCRRGYLSRMTVNLLSESCLIEEEDSSRLSHDCFNIVLNQ